MAAIGTDATYKQLFQKAYGRAPNYDDVGRAIASFERTLIFLDAPFDRFMAGNANAISPAAQRGLALFNGKARCVSCHMINASNPLGTDNLFHNIGVSARTQNFEQLAQKGLAATKNGSGSWTGDGDCGVSRHWGKSTSGVRWRSRSPGEGVEPNRQKIPAKSLRIYLQTATL